MKTNRYIISLSFLLSHTFIFGQAQGLYFTGSECNSEFWDLAYRLDRGRGKRPTQTCRTDDQVLNKTGFKLSTPRQ